MLVRQNDWSRVKPQQIKKVSTGASRTNDWNNWNYWCDWNYDWNNRDDRDYWDYRRPRSKKFRREATGLKTELCDNTHKQACGYSHQILVRITTRSKKFRNNG